MKKAAFVFLLSFGLLSLNATAQTNKSFAPSVRLLTVDSTHYLGKYKYEGLPFEYMEISLKENKLYYSGGEYSGFLEALKDKKDAFDASGQAVFTFVRNDQNKVTELHIDYQGQTYTGKKE